MDPGCAIGWRDGLAEIRLACGKANALNPRSLAALAAAFEEARRADAAGVVLTGYDGHFSAGLDLVTLYELPPAAMDAFMRAFDRVMLETLDDLRRAFVEAWYSPDARERIGAARARLSG